jgi:hypothetical protein
LKPTSRISFAAVTVEADSREADCQHDKARHDRRGESRLRPRRRYQRPQRRNTGDGRSAVDLTHEAPQRRSQIRVVRRSTHDEGREAADAVRARAVHEIHFRLSSVISVCPFAW